MVVPLKAREVVPISGDGLARMASSALAESHPGRLLPDLPGKVHGIKQRGPEWMVQCDDCLTCWAGSTLVFVAKAATFIAAVPGVRLCKSCWNLRGWFENYHGWYQSE